MRERVIQAWAIKEFAKRGVPCIRLYFGPGSARGWPDSIFLIPGGKPLFIEFKGTLGVLGLAQERKIKKLRNLGYDVEVCCSKDETRQIILERLDPA